MAQNYWSLEHLKKNGIPLSGIGSSVSKHLCFTFFLGLRNLNGTGLDGDIQEDKAQSLTP